jgi:hypothetical protein
MYRQAGRPIDGFIARMEEELQALVADDDRGRFFHAAYLRITYAVRDEIQAARFADPEWVERWEVVFAGLYLSALDSWRAGRQATRPWAIAFQAAESRLAPLRHVLLGINAHVNYDLPQSLLAVISDEEFADPGLRHRRAADHEQIDSVLASRVAAEDHELAKDEGPGDRTVLDRMLQPFNRAGTERFLREARQKAWHNAQLLSAARRVSDAAMTSRMAELEDLSANRIEDLVEPRFVLLELARHGFGVTLRP